MKKKKIYSLRVIGESVSKNIRNDDFYTTDTDAWLEFSLEDKKLIPETMSISLVNINDGSVINEVVTLTEPKTILFRLDPEIIVHAGTWHGQIVFESKGEMYTGSRFSFGIVSNVMDNKVPQLIKIVNINHVNKMLDELIQKGDEFEDIVASARAQVDANILTTALEDKYASLESEYAPRLTNLEQNDTNLTAQLAHNHDLAGNAFSKTTKIVSKSLTGKGFMVIVDDDARIEVMDKLLPLSQQYGIPFVVAASVRSGNTTPAQDLTKEQLLYLQNNLGWEIAGHGYTHIGLHGESKEVVEYEVAESKRVLQSWGLDIKNYVAPYGHIEEPMIREIVSKYYNTASRAQGGVNKRPVKNYYLHRPPLGSFFVGNEGTLEFYKTKVDEAYNGDHLLIFMTHVWADEHDDVQQGYLRAVIEYAQSLGMPIGTMQEGYERYGNMLEVGGVTALGNDGTTFGFSKEATYKKVGPGSRPQDMFFATTPADIFANHRNKTTETRFSIGLNQPFPESKAGTLITYAHDSTLDLWQEWHPYKKPESVFYRHAISTTEWSEFTPAEVDINHANTFIRVSPGNDSGYIMFNKTPSEIFTYHKNKVILTTFSLALAQPFPESSAGTLTTYAVDSVGMMWQEWKPYQKPHLVYYRHATSSTTWSTFVR